MTKSIYFQTQFVQKDFIALEFIILSNSSVFQNIFPIFDSILNRIITTTMWSCGKFKLLLKALRIIIIIKNRKKKPSSKNIESYVPYLRNINEQGQDLTWRKDKNHGLFLEIGRDETERKMENFFSLNAFVTVSMKKFINFKTSFCPKEFFCSLMYYSVKFFRYEMESL